MFGFEPGNRPTDYLRKYQKEEAWLLRVNNEIRAREKKKGGNKDLFIEDALLGRKYLSRVSSTKEFPF